MKTHGRDVEARHDGQLGDSDLRPFWKRIRSELLTQSAIHADEMVMQVHKEKGRTDTSESRMWVYSSTKRADIQLRCFEYRESRSGKWAKYFLEGFNGVLITDGYSGYNKVQEGVVLGDVSAGNHDLRYRGIIERLLFAKGKQDEAVCP